MFQHFRQIFNPFFLGYVDFKFGVGNNQEFYIFCVLTPQKSILDTETNYYPALLVNETSLIFWILTLLERFFCQTGQLMINYPDILLLCHVT